MAKTFHKAVSKAYIEAVCRACVTARAGFGSIRRPGQPRNSFKSQNRSSLRSLRRRSGLFWLRTAARARLVLAAGPTSPLGFVVAVLAEDGHGLGWGAFESRVGFWGPATTGWRPEQLSRITRITNFSLGGHVLDWRFKRLSCRATVGVASDSPSLQCFGDKARLRLPSQALKPSMFFGWGRRLHLPSQAFKPSRI